MDMKIILGMCISLLTSYSLATEYKNVKNECSELKNISSIELFWNDFRDMVVNNKISCLPMANELMIVLENKETKIKNEERFKVVYEILDLEAKMKFDLKTGMSKNITQKMLIRDTEKLNESNINQFKNQIKVGRMLFGLKDNTWYLEKVYKGYMNQDYALEQYIYCIGDINKKYEVVIKSNGENFKNKDHSWCTCMLNEKPNDFIGSLLELSNTKENEKITSFCNKYAKLKD